MWYHLMAKNLPQFQEEVLVRKESYQIITQRKNVLSLDYINTVLLIVKILTADMTGKHKNKTAQSAEK